MVDIMSYKPPFTYTAEPIEYPDDWDGLVPIEVFKSKLHRYLAIERARRSPMLKALSKTGKPLYVLSSSGTLNRTSKITKATRQKVLIRDGHQCVTCGSDKGLELDHIERYIDGGSNEPENLWTLCHDCHGKRGGRR